MEWVSWLRLNIAKEPQKHFYGLALCCSWPSSVLGQMLFNHKTTKKPFRRYFYIMTFLNIIGVSVYLYPVIQLY
ncbi:DUF1294 domain-containing protein [Psychromonas sp. KJ10-2]|uniref:DUF1294 domain-containing protein n=1 Tax=Psychromonas sp. KJ10-2 TaxID=3391822 RepID=UPI0039B6AC4A